MKKILFITYDGLTDSLGQSQILPYMVGLAKAGHQVTILSCEKNAEFSKNSPSIKKFTLENNIRWEYITFTVKPPILSKIYDQIRLKQKAKSLYLTHKFDVIHCRSYVPAAIGLFLKQKYGVKFIFDMRGFWADERKDSGAWNIKKPLFKYLYKTYKHKEKEFLLNADAVIVLTRSAAKEIKSWEYLKNHVLNMEVIPCSADLEHFSLNTQKQKLASRQLLNIADTDLVISYLGSLGTYYMLDEMLQFFCLVKNKYQTSKFLIVTHSNKEIVFNKLKQYSLLPSDVIVKSATRNEVPTLIKASDISLSFIIPTYSKIASSPTKVGETLAMGIPIIANTGIGDMADMRESGGCFLLQNFSETQLYKAINAMPNMLNLDPKHIREQILGDYDLNRAIDKYLMVYSKLDVAMGNKCAE